MEFNTPGHVALVASNNEAHKLDRLRRVVKLTCALMGLSYAQYCKLVDSLTDDRGTLRVLWCDAPTETQRRAFATAWELCGEDKSHIVHTSH